MAISFFFLIWELFLCLIYIYKITGYPTIGKEGISFQALYSLYVNNHHITKRVPCLIKEVACSKTLNIAGYWSGRPEF